MDFQLRGKRALVSGASGGIGASIARTLAAEGVSVVVHGRDEARAAAVARQISIAGGVAAIALGDLSNEAGVQSVALVADKAFGGIDILVNNAGAPSDAALGMGMFDLDPKEWVSTYERNLISALRLSAYFSPQMKERGWGRIIQITSGLAYAPRGLQGDYTASKAALNNFTFNLSRALANTGVTVNGISPGMTVTPMLEEWLASVAEANGLGRDIAKGEEFVLKNMFQTTVARLGQPQDVANAVAYIASPLADYVNGTTLRVDGGGSPAVN
jgi:NAD(P)-dependent dehydrogenase (short-subunit alcohol dehydrogenase family)